MSYGTIDPNQLLTIKQTADLLGISPRSVWRLVRDNKLKARKIRGATRIRRRDIDDFSNES